MPMRKPPSDLGEQRLRQRQLAAVGEVVTAETLRLARNRRDEKWTLIRQAYVERSRNPADLARELGLGKIFARSLRVSGS